MRIRKPGSLLAAPVRGCARILLGLAAFSPVFLSTASGQDIASAIDRIRQAGTLTVAVYAEDAAPFFYTDETGTLVGIDPTLAEDIAAKLGVTVAYNRNATTFDGVVDEVVEGRADVAISLLSDTLDRAMRVGFSRSYVSLRQYLLVNRLELGKLLAASPDSAAAIPDVLNSEAVRIGVERGTSYVGFVEEDFPRAQKVEFGNWGEMLAAVKAGTVTALMYDELVIRDWRLADPAGALELRPVRLEGHADTIAIAVRQGDADLKAWIDLYLTKMIESGALAVILDRHLYSTDLLPADD